MLADSFRPMCCTTWPARARTTPRRTLGPLSTRCIPWSRAAPGPSSLPGRRSTAVYDAGNRWSLPGRLVITEQRTRSADSEAHEAFQGAGATYDFFSQLFGRSSIDGRGMRINSTVHYGNRFANAMWNAEQIIYGDGVGELFGRFTAAVEVIAHELTHGITQYTAGLLYKGQSGALNEHISDAFGIMVRQFLSDQTAEQSDWLIGKGLLTARVNGHAVRSMAAPGTAYDDPILGRDPQPSHMRKYVRSNGDNGGIHINRSWHHHHPHHRRLAGLQGRQGPLRRPTMIPDIIRKQARSAITGRWLSRGEVRESARGEAAARSAAGEK